MSDRTFSIKEVTETLIKQSDLHQGLWVLRINLKLEASNIGPSHYDLTPAAIVKFLSIGLEMGDKDNDLSVDAAKVNPETSWQHKRRRKKF